MACHVPADGPEQLVVGALVAAVAVAAGTEDGHPALDAQQLHHQLPQVGPLVLRVAPRDPRHGREALVLAHEILAPHADAGGVVADGGDVEGEHPGGDDAHLGDDPRGARLVDGVQHPAQVGVVEQAGFDVIAEQQAPVLV